jgi:hypothetical protein
MPGKALESTEKEHCKLLISTISRPFGRRGNGDGEDKAYGST